jgi:hypothetical protein
MAGSAWSDEENDLIVRDYFSMLREDILGRPYSKADHRRRLMEKIGRSAGSIEFKHQNISAVVRAFGQPIIQGYKPAHHFQESLISAVNRYLLQFDTPVPEPQSWPGFAEDQALLVGPSPTQRNAPETEEEKLLTEISRRYDVAARDAARKFLGQAGEERVLAHERQTLLSEGRGDLAKKVRWTSREEGDGAGFDIESFTPNGGPRLIEVKTTNGWERTPFHISRNELRVAERERDSWVLFRLYDFARAPKAFELRPPLDRHVALTATDFRADFR